MCAESAASSDQGRRLADPAPGRGSELFDQPFGDQLADEVGDRHPGQSGRPGQVGPARGTVAEELLEQQGAVVTAGVLLEPLALGAERASGVGERGRHIC